MLKAEQLRYHLLLVTQQALESFLWTVWRWMTIKKNLLPLHPGVWEPYMRYFYQFFTALLAKYGYLLQQTFLIVFAQATREGLCFWWEWGGDQRVWCHGPMNGYTGGWAHWEMWRSARKETMTSTLCLNVDNSPGRLVLMSLFCSVFTVYFYVWVHWVAFLSEQVNNWTSKYNLVLSHTVTKTNTMPTVWLYCLCECKCVSAGHRAFHIFCTVFWPQASEPWRL